VIKKIKNFICKLFGIKACKCDDIDEHEELYLHVPEPEIPLYTDENGKAIKCGTHNRYKKSCSICKEVAGVA
jgi:hypothetical protein|tara:strand:+ start:306 stop:521 length:216 start_codon:yes stop_codon:yes gene_type:complete